MVWDRVLGNCQGKVIHITALWLCVGRAQKENSASAWPLELCLGGSCLLALILIPVTSLSPHMPQMPFQLLPSCWIPEGVGLYQCWVHCGPFKRSLLCVLQFPSSPQPPLVFTARSYGDLITLEPWAGWSALRLGYLTPEVFLLVFIQHTWVWDCPSVSLHLCVCLCISVPPTHLDECSVFKSLVVRPPHRSIFWLFWEIFVL